jgi:hypothetical protein
MIDRVEEALNVRIEPQLTFRWVIPTQIASSALCWLRSGRNP